MMMSSSQRNAYSYGDALYWDARYLADGNASFDWYQRYSALRPFVRKYVPVSARVLMVGCGNAVMSEDMVKDGYIDIMNIDISSVVTEMMRKKYTHIPQLRWTLDSLMCGVDATLSASRMLEEANRLLRPGGIYMLITYGDPSVRIPHLNQPGCNWNKYYIPGQDSKAMEGVVRKGQSWNLSHLPNVVSYHQVLFLKIQTRTTYMFARRNMDY
ncbi:hypothetical protein C4D60_Mb06t24420 [Musa balbisiana]|uniref:Methyltransferase type 11 domain-containing protein n=1 Tax=Musa balbisiana TaxID=52838 RepID=A0A4S8IQG8_MUSBA|nr:hypothetical protein C4D60_Mb06t24420 [Musa balbisiana]